MTSATSSRFRSNNDPHPFPIRFIPQILNAFDFFFFDQFGNLLDQPGFVDLIG